MSCGSWTASSLIIIFSVKIESCEIPILSVDHAFGPSVAGQYFNFNMDKIFNFGAGQTLTFLAYNSRTSVVGEVVVWGSTNGGSVGDSHGRFNRRNVAPSPGQWRTGDKLIPIDDYYCPRGGWNFFLFNPLIYQTFGTNPRFL